MPMIQRDFWRTAVEKVPGKYSRTDTVLASRRLRPKRLYAGTPVSSGASTDTRAKISVRPCALSLKPMS